jgi:hypothetical protein
MIRLKNLIRESQSISSVELLTNKLDAFREESNHTDWYMQGGCYSFAAALNQVLQGSQIILIGDSISDLAHACVLWKGKYVDYNTVSSNMQDITSDIALEGAPKNRVGKLSDISGEHNFDPTEVKKIVASLLN